MTRPPRLPHNAGIAIGPILFIIAILGILAAAVAAGSGSFTGGTSQQKAKAMASTLLEQATNLDFCVQRVRGRDNGYDDTQIDFSVPAGMFLRSDSVDMGQTTPVAACTSDACKVYKPAGGGCVPAQTPPDAVDETVMDSWGMGCSLGSNGCRVVWTTLVQLQIEGVSAPIHLAYWPWAAITKDVCMKINDLIGVTNPSGDAPHGAGAVSSGSCGAYDCNFYGSGNSTLGTVVYDASQTFTANKDFCYWDAGWGQYAYVHVLK